MPMQTIAVVDYGMGNLRSVAKAVEHVAGREARVLLSSDVKEISAADRIIFPGQGAARECMRALDRHNLRETLHAAVANKPFLGICMGLQVLMSSSHENQGTACLDVIPGTVDYFGGIPEFDSSSFKIPHMGWNRVRQRRKHPLWKDVPDNTRFYFVHSYYVNPQDADVIAGMTEYGSKQFTSAISRGNLFAVQFHPEKSAAYGLQVLRNFVNWNGIG